jgi:hypothetical protein
VQFTTSFGDSQIITPFDDCVITRTPRSTTSARRCLWPLPQPSCELADVSAPGHTETFASYVDMEQFTCPQLLCVIAEASGGTPLVEYVRDAALLAETCTETYEGDTPRYSGS